MMKAHSQVNPHRCVQLLVAIAVTTLTTTAWSEEASPEAPAATAETETAPEAEPEAPAEAAEPEAEVAEPEATEPVAEAGEDEAAEEEEQEQEEEEDNSRRHDDFSHRMQGGVALLAGTGYQFDVAYGGNYCYQDETSVDEQPSVCNKRSPVYFDFHLSFGVTDGLEILLEYRLGLLEETWGAADNAEPTTSRPMAWGLGLRYFISPETRVKFFIGAILSLGYAKNLDKAMDFLVRPIFGLQIEIVRWVAFFVQASVNLSFIRNFGIALEGGGGFQFRFP